MFKDVCIFHPRCCLSCSRHSQISSQHQTYSVNVQLINLDLST